ncbi:MAG: CDP-glycerol glycerophosphotransferase family protein [Eubacterium sp.]|nr:CDP-glycerol glycerophosphotransferase family protein [Eubacterium sp.]
MSIVTKMRKKAGSVKVTLRRSKYAGYYKHKKVDSRVILYDSYFGRGLICNPYALFLEFLKEPDLKHVWVLDANASTDHFPKAGNVSFVRRHSKEHLKYLASAGYIITNVSMPYYYCKKPGQIYINTWHGTPLKSIGYDIPNSEATISNVIRNFLSSDYIISQNPFLTSVYQEKYKLDGIFQGKIIEEGYPRNDRLVNASRDEVLRSLSSYGINVDETKEIILYAPTWKGNDYYKPEINVEDFTTFLNTLETMIDSNRYQILVKPHQVVYQTLKKQGKLLDFMIPAEMDTNELLSITDVLISDYSSIFYDFLASGKPVLFYIEDLEKYKEDRGLYLQPSELPGPACTTLSDLGDAINNLHAVMNEYHEKYEAAKQFACPYDDGQAAQRIVDIVLRGKTQDDSGRSYRIIEPKPNRKKKVLFFGGGLRLNGISTALRNMLQYMDYEKYDVTLFAANLKLEECEKMICSFPEQVRAFARIDYTPATFTEQIRNDFLRVFGFHFPLMKKIYPKAMYDREYLRCFGSSQFDAVVDYSGYGSFYSILLLSANHAKKLIWQHNDLNVDKIKVIDGKRPHNRELRVVFSTYDFYDYIVGCSEDVMKVNLEKIGYNHLKEHCAFVRNTANFDRVLDSVKEPLSAEAAEALGIQEIFEDNRISFVNMGRLSPEKNQAELILAFAKLQKEYENARLYILGDGPLREKLQALISDNGLNGKVFMTGNVENPFQIMKECDCFVLPSLYEGQPVSILEARLLSMPILMSKFSSYRSAVIPDGQLLVGTDADSICQGMKQFIEQGAPAYHFSDAEYNAETMKQLDHLLL